MGVIEAAAYDMVFKDQGIRMKSCSEALRRYETEIEDILDAAEFLRALSKVVDGRGYSILCYAHILEREVKKQRCEGPTWGEYSDF